MNFNLSRRVLNPPQSYVCSSCSLGNISHGHYYHQQFQHTTTPQVDETSPENLLESYDTYKNGEISASAAPPVNQSHEGSTQAENITSSPSEDLTQSTASNAASIQATKLQQTLQRQFAERRRVNLAQSDNKNIENLKVSKTEDAGSQSVGGKSARSRSPTLTKKTTSIAAEAQKSLKSIRQRRLISRYQSASKIRAQVVPRRVKCDTRTLKDLSTDTRAAEGEKPVHSGMDPFTALHAKVHELKRSLEAEDKSKRITKIQLSRLRTPNDPVAASTQSMPKAPATRTTDSDLFRVVSTTAKAANHVPKGMKPQKDGLASSVASARSKSKVSKKADSTPLKPPRRVGSKKNAAIEVVNAERLDISAVEMDQPPVPNLSYGLDRVLFNPGVYHLQDPRSRVYNFDPYLQKIMPVNEFDFSALKAYVTSSGDEALKRIAETQGKRYVGSSSSMTSILAHFHFLLSQWREIGTNMLSNEFPKSASRNFTLIQKAPTAVFLKWRDGTYAIDADKQYANANLLMMLGKSMEKLLTMDKDDFERYRRSNGHEVPAEERDAPESYHYSTMGDFLMRSQLDAHDARLPGTGMFDLKTRAVVSVRMDAQEVEKGRGYEIKTRQGAWESYEREYYDMIRSAMLKYSLQVRMGRMDGIFVAYHNTQRIFGFQYISLAEMDAALHGQWDTTLGDQQFKVSLDLLNKVLDRATKKYPEQSLRIHFETRDAQTPFMYIFAEPVTEEQIQAIQSENNAEVSAYERKILGLHEDNASNDQEDDDGKWADMQADVENEMEKDEISLNHPDNELVASSIAKEQNNLDDGDSEALNKGPLWESVHAQKHNDDSVAALINDEESEEYKSEQGTLAGNGDEDTVDAQQAPEAGLGASAPLVEGLEEDHKTTKTGGMESRGEQETEPDVDASSDVATAQVVEETESDTSTNSPLTVENLSGESPEEEESRSSQVDDGITLEADAPFLDSAAKDHPIPSTTEEVLAMTLTIRNRVNNSYVLRPENLSAGDKWSVEYAMAEVGDRGKAWSLYQASQARRKKALVDDQETDETKQLNSFMQNLRDLSEKGERWRQEQDKRDKGRPIVVLGQSSPSGELYNTGEEAVSE